jgi:hypothetical protein
MSYRFFPVLSDEHLCRNHLSALPSLVPRAGQQLPVFMLAHFFPSFLDDTTQPITSFAFFYLNSLQIKKNYIT